jgi:hypothetical protein
MKKSPAEECDASRELEKRPAPDAAPVYDTTSAGMPDLPHGKSVRNNPDKQSSQKEARLRGPLH